MASSKAKVLVVDSNAFIKAVRLETIGEKFYTVPQVLSEVRDAKARQFMASFPFPINEREPSPVALKTVASFAKKTGDYPFLSPVDLRVLALVYTLEVEAKGSAQHLRTEPLKAGAVSDLNKQEKEEDEDEEGEEDEDDEEGEEIEGEAAEKVSGDKENTPPTEPTKDTPTTSSQPAAPQEEEKEIAGESETKEEDDDDGWITPDNIGIVKAKRGQAEDDLKAESVAVGCFTTDFAMQSVLLQMGLKLLSVEGMVIKRIRQYVLKCHSCFKICKDMERKFCPTCGNSTLLRFAASTDDEGNLVYTQAQRLHNRGTIFSIPLPKGGRNSGDLVLTEDQYLHKTKYMKDPKAADVFSSEYSFAQGKSGPQKKVVVGYGNKNPNVAKRRIGKKNKPISALQ